MVDPALLHGFELNPLGPGVDVEPVAAQKSDEGHPEFTGHIHRQAARRGDRADDGHTGREALLQDLEAAAPADHDGVIPQRQSSLEESPPEELVGRVVAPHVFPEGYEISLRAEVRRRVQPAGSLEETLRLAQLLGEDVDRLRRHLRSRRDHGAPAELELLQARLAAHTAGARGVEVALEGPQVVLPATAQLHVDDVVLLLGVDVRVHAVADLLYLLWRRDDALTVQKPRGELEVRPRRPHGDGDGLPL